MTDCFIVLGNFYVICLLIHGSEFGVLRSRWIKIEKKSD